MKNRVIILFVLAALFVSTGAGMLWFKANVYEKGRELRAVKDPYCSMERQFAVIVNGDREKESFLSALRDSLTQKYSHFQVYAVSELDPEYARDLPRKHHLTIVPQEKRPFEEVVHEIVHDLPAHTVVLLLDEGERIVAKTALSSLNRYYSGADVWCTYGQTKTPLSKTYSYGELSKEATTLNKVGPCISFLASTYQQIPLGEHLNGLTFQRRGFVRPLIAVSQGHTYHVEEPLFEGQAYTDIHYLAIGSVSPSHHVERPSCDLIAFSYNRPLQLMALLESTQQNIDGLQHTFVLYRADDSYEAAYEHLKTQFPMVTFMRQSKDHPKEDFKGKFVELAFGGRYSRSSHIMFAVDDIIVTSPVDLHRAMELQEKTHAHGVYLRLGKNIDYCYMLDKAQAVPRSKAVGSSLFAYAIADGALDWRYPNTVDMTMYKKRDIEETLLSLDFSNPSELEAKWDDSSAFDYLGLRKDGDQKNTSLMGLFYEHSKTVNIPLNKVAEVYANRSMEEYTPEELLDIFAKGYKIDVEKVRGVENHSCHAEIDLNFTENERIFVD